MLKLLQPGVCIHLSACPPVSRNNDDDDDDDQDTIPAVTDQEGRDLRSVMLAYMPWLHTRTSMISRPFFCEAPSPSRPRIEQDPRSQSLSRDQLQDPSRPPMYGAESRQQTMRDPRPRVIAGLDFWDGLRP